MREFILDTDSQNFWTQLIEKEQTLRNQWYLKYIEEKKKKSAYRLQRDGLCEKRQDIKKYDVQQMSDLPHFEKIDFYPKAKISATSKIMKSSPALMRPASSMTRGLIYVGDTVEGRIAYLKARNLLEPEMRYQYPPTSGHRYGWKIRDETKKMEIKPAIHGRTKIVLDSFYRSNGVFK